MDSLNGKPQNIYANVRKHLYIIHLYSFVPEIVSKSFCSLCFFLYIFHSTTTTDHHRHTMFRFGRQVTGAVLAFYERQNDPVVVTFVPDGCLFIYDNMHTHINLITRNPLSFYLSGTHTHTENYINCFINAAKSSFYFNNINNWSETNKQLPSNQISPSIRNDRLHRIRFAPIVEIYNHRGRIGKM